SGLWPVGRGGVAAGNPHRGSFHQCGCAVAHGNSVKLGQDIGIDDAFALRASVASLFGIWRSGRRPVVVTDAACYTPGWKALKLLGGRPSNSWVEGPQIPGWKALNVPRNQLPVISIGIG